MTNAENTIHIMNEFDDLIKEYVDVNTTYDYLLEPANFISLPDLLMNTMVSKGICNENDDRKTFVTKLHNPLFNQDQMLGRELNEANQRRILSRVFRGSRGISRERAIEIAFALKLNLEETLKFINDAGFSTFNVRNAADSIFMYCLVREKSIVDAYNLINKVYTIIPVSATADANRYSHSGSTTNIIEDSIRSDSWESDEKFFNEFLVPNSGKFLGYSTTALNEYFKIKNRLYINYIYSTIITEMHYHDEDSSNGTVDKGTVPSDALSLREKVLNEVNSNPHLFKIDSYNLRNKDIIPILNQIRKTVYSADSLRQSEEYSNFFTSIIPIHILISNIINESYLNNLPTNYDSQSNLPKEITKYFPQDSKFFNDFEKNPANVIYSSPQEIWVLDTTKIRKAIILLYFFDFVYGFNMASRLGREDVDDRDFTFASFFEELNSILTKCRLGILNPLNQFDWLILRSVREMFRYDVNEDSDYLDNPINFFSDILKRSFGESTEESTEESIEDD